MPALEETWLPVAHSLGFNNEKEMLEHLYNEAKFSLKEIEHVIGYSYISIRRRLMLYGIELRNRGGPHRTGRRRLLALSNSEVKFTPPNDLARKYNVHISTVFAEKRLRKAQMGEIAWNSVLGAPQALLSVDEEEKQSQADRSTLEDGTEEGWVLDADALRTNRS